MLTRFFRFRINTETERQDAESMGKLDEWKKETFEIRKLLDNLKDKFNSLNSENPNNREECDEQMIEIKVGQIYLKSPLLHLLVLQRFLSAQC